MSAKKKAKKSVPPAKAAAPKKAKAPVKKSAAPLPKESSKMRKESPKKEVAVKKLPAKTPAPTSAKAVHKETVTEDVKSKPKKSALPEGGRSYASFLASLSPHKILTAEGWKRAVLLVKKRDSSS